MKERSTCSNLKQGLSVLEEKQLSAETALAALHRAKDDEVQILRDELAKAQADKRRILAGVQCLAETVGQNRKSFTLGSEHRKVKSYDLANVTELVQLGGELQQSELAMEEWKQGSLMHLQSELADREAALEITQQELDHLRASPGARQQQSGSAAASEGEVGQQMAAVRILSMNVTKEQKQSRKLSNQVTDLQAKIKQLPQLNQLLDSSKALAKRVSVLLLQKYKSSKVHSSPLTL